ncbi:MAG: aldose 1-epimerase family protein [Anaerolineae bacterium]|nr:aldose 1-epimerase family protein [Anaerolineae bacterium]
MIFNPNDWTRETIRRHSLDMRQFIDFRQSTLSNGMRIIEAYNSSGLTFTLLPDRGMDIWTAHYKGIPLTWIAPGSPHSPDFGQNWLQQFNGGLLTTCGLTHVGPPEHDEITGEWRDIHGPYTRFRAQNINIHGEWITETNHELSLSSTIYQSTLFGTQIRVERKIWQNTHTPSLRLADTITNLGDQAVPLMVLYHINLGFPLIQQGTQLVTPFERVYPRDQAAKAGFETWPRYEAAQASYAEQVFFHHLKITNNGYTETLLINREETFGISLQWDTTQLPYLTQWKNTRQGIYVSGIEPGNCIPEGQNAARRNGRLATLEPGQSIETGWRLEILEGADHIKEHKEGVLQLQREGSPNPTFNLHDYASQE